MPVSHLGLTVSHIPSATSFYLAALQPLGYRYIGSRNDSIGLGVFEADFFLTQAPHGYRYAPTHIAFTAEDKIAVRECYVAAVRAGARPNGPPEYREDDCGCFNAAVEDHDGNTVEFIWRDNDLGEDREPVLDYSRARPPVGRSQTSRDLLPAGPPGAGLKRSSTEPADGMSSKALFGVVLGAAVGAAASYMIRNDKSDQRRSSPRRMSPRRAARDDAYEEDRRYRDDYLPPRTGRSASVTAGERSYRRSSGGEPRRSRYQSDVRALDSRPYYRDDEEIAYVRTRVTRQSQGHTRAIEAVEYAPSRFSMKRSSTMPVEQQQKQQIEEPVRESRRGSVPESRRSRRDSVVSGAASKASRHSSARVKSSTSQASTIKPAKKSTTYYVATPSQVPLPESVASRSGESVAPRPKSSVVPRSRESSRRRSNQPGFDAYYLEDPDDGDDGLSDNATIVPDDSISCVGLPRTSRSGRWEKPSSVTTLPIRGVREDYPRTRTAWSQA